MKISKQEYSLLTQLHSMTEKSLIKAIPKILAKYFDNPRIHPTSDYIYVEGDTPVALVAHLDTVHPFPPKQIYHDPTANIIWSPDGLGADDRAGLFGILYLLEEGYRPSIILTTGEEEGGVGARVFVKDFKEPLSSLLFLVELDRQGEHDAVYYECGNADFENFITSFGFVTNYGSFSDISVIAPAWDIAAVNLSIGYFDEHTRIERLNYRFMFNTLKKVGRLLEEPGDHAYDFQSLFTKGWDWDWNNADIPPDFVHCDFCNVLHPFKDCKIVSDSIVCNDCYPKHVDTCTECNQPFINVFHTKKEKVCVRCANQDEQGQFNF